jgi:chorismate synthase
LAFKPPSSIRRAQQSVDPTSGLPVDLRIEGAHDPLIAARAVPVVEALLVLGLADLWLRWQADRAGRAAATGERG